MPLNSRDLWLVLKAQDQSNRALNTFSRNVKFAGESVYAANLLAQRSAVQASIGQNRLANEMRQAEVAALNAEKAMLKNNVANMMLTGTTNDQLGPLRQRIRAIDETVLARRAEIASTSQAIVQDKVRLTQLDQDIKKEKEHAETIRAHDRALAQLSGRLQAAGQTATAAGFAMSVAGVASLVAIKKAIDVNVEYERQVRLTATQIGDFSGNLKELGEIGKRVAANIAVPFETIQPALYDIFSSIDVNVPEAERLLNSFAQAAVAGQTDIQSVSRATIGLMNAFHRPVSDINHLLDLQFQLVRLGVGTYDEWNQRIGLVSPSAIRAGQSIETMVAALATSTRMGIAAARSGAAVSRAFDALSHPTTVKNLKALGINVQDATGKFRPFNQVLGEFRTALLKLPEKDRLATIIEVFKGAGGTIEARRFLQNILLGAGNLELFDSILQRTSESAGAMGQAYDLMAESVASKTQLLKNQWMLLQASIGEALAPVFSQIIQIFSNLLEKFNKLSPETKRLIALFVLGTGVFAAIVGPLLLVAGAIAMVVGAFVLAGPAILATFAVIGGGIAVLAGAAAAFYVLYTRASEFRVLVGQVGQYFILLRDVAVDAAKSMVTSFRDNLLPPLRELYHLIAEKVMPQFTIWMNFVVSTVMPKIKEAARIIQSIFGKAMQFIGWVITTLVIPAIDALSNWWENNKKEIEPLLPVLAQVVKWFLIIAAVVTGVLVAAFVGPLVAAVAAVIAVFAGLVAAVVYVIKGAKWLWQEIVMVAGGIRDFFVAAWNGIVAALTTAWNAIVAVVMAGLGVLKGIWDSFWNVFGGLFKAVWDLIVAIANLGMAALTFVFQWGKKILTAFWNDMWPPFYNTVKGIWDAIVGYLKQAWVGISNFASSTFNFVKGVITGAWNTIKAITINTWNAVYSAISGPLRAAHDEVVSVFDRIRRFFDGARNWLVQAGKNIIQGLIDGLTSMIEKVTSIINSITKTIRDHLPHSPAKVGPLSGKGSPYYSGKAISNLLAAGMVDNMDTVQKASVMLARGASIDGYATAGNLGGNASGMTKNYYVTQNITTQEIDPRVHSAQLGWELQGVI